MIDYCYSEENHTSDQLYNFENALEKLEFYSVLNRIQRYVFSEPAKNSIRLIAPSISISEIQHRLKEVSEAKELLIAEGTAPLDGIKSISTSLKMSLVENHTLEPRELYEIAQTLSASRTLQIFLDKRRTQYPLLSEIARLLYIDKVVEFNIFQAIEEDGRVKDSASRVLKSIRSDIISQSESLRKKLFNIVRRVSEEEMTQEDIITTRDGRLVIPIKTEYKKRVPGFVHSSSASGATVFIEPAETLEMNNVLLELHLQEQREIHRILRELTNQVRGIAESLSNTLQILVRLDLIFAKAKYSIEIIGSEPKILESGIIKLKGARHPGLLQKHRRDEVVPLDLELGGNVNTLIITGPNAGGKSVAMKTVGLLVLCTQSGIHIPAHSESEIPIFHKIFVDIGDEQSIENDLSTFSSHLVHLAKVLNEADNKSLVLIDEIGAGTDPAEGSSLATAVLTDLSQRGTTTITTTHHGTLKVFAHSTEGVMNGSMEFDQQNLSPTYRFRPNVPGSSYALELAQRMGIPESIRNNARTNLGEQASKMENLLLDLDRQVQQLREDSTKATIERSKLNSLIAEYEEKLKGIRQEASKIKKKSQEEATQLINDAKSLIERSIKEIKESQAERKVVKEVKEKFLQEAEKLTSLDDSSDIPREISFDIGDRVRILDGTSVGEVIEIRGNSAVVLIGNSKITVRISNLRKAEGKRTEIRKAENVNFVHEARNEIDLRGMMGDEAVSAAERFLDDAYMSGFHKVYLIHGKGTGALRKRINEFLKTYPRLRSCHLGEWNEGGDGVTVVELSTE